MALTRLNTPTGISIPSAANINLDSPTAGNQVHVTGSTAITSVTLTSGNKTIIFDGVLTLTHNSTSNNLPGGVNITTAVGDRALYVFDGTTVYCISYIKASGASGSLVNVLYANRANLRTTTPLSGDQVLINGLGIFVFVLGSVEPDDDETAFVNATGTWELVASDPDYVFASGLADFDQLQGQVDDGAAANAKLLRSFFVMSLTSLGTVASSSFTATVTGAAVGDSVIVNPGNTFGTSTTDQALLSYVAYVSATNTVTVSIRNASAAAASMTASTWSILVIKQ